MQPQIEFYEVFAVTDNARGTVDLFRASASNKPSLGEAAA
jgi:hypothetical protein